MHIPPPLASAPLNGDEGAHQKRQSEHEASHATRHGLCPLQSYVDMECMIVVREGEVEAWQRLFLHPPFLFL